jgi:hypothetical protein
MRSYKLGVSVAAVLMLVTTTSWAGTKPIKGTAACSFSPLNVDFSGDGITGSLNNCIGKFNGGSFTSQTQSELGAPLASPQNCPAGTTEYPYVEQVSVTSTSSKDQTITGGPSTGFFCASKSDNSFTYDLTEEYFQGVGKWKGITGQIHHTGAGSFWACTAQGQCFGNYVDTFNGTATLP